jgi:hypothetical protein
MTKEELEQTYVDLRRCWKTLLNFITAYASDVYERRDQISGEWIILDTQDVEIQIDREDIEEYKKSYQCAVELQDHILKLKEHIKELENNNNE